MGVATRIALIVVAAAVAAVAFVVLSSSDDEDEPVANAPGEPAGEEADGPGAAGDRRAPIPSEVTRIEVEDDAPVGGLTEIEVEQGEQVELMVRADAAEEVHVHGYDLFADVTPAKPAELRFRADLEGVYEVELEDSHTQIAILTVEP